MSKAVLNKDICFIKAVFSWLKKNPKKNVTTKLEGGGGKALVAGPLKKYISFFAASLDYLAE